MVETELSPIHAMPSGLCEDPSGEAAALIARMGKGDESALVALHGLWSAILLGIACQILGDHRDAEKVVQDTFVHLWQRAAGYAPHQTPPFVWAFTVMRGICMKRLGRNRRALRHSAHVGASHPSSPPDKPDHLRVVTADDFRRVRAALDHLTPDERGTLVAAVFLQHSQGHAPRIENAPIGTVKNHLRQALKKIRNHLSRYEL